MKISFKLLLLFLLFFFTIKLPTAEAAAFTNAYLRLNNQTTNSSLSGTVCAQPSSSGAGTENKVSVTFPDDFTVSAVTSNWTTNTTNLPSGATAWPSIGSPATTVSGQTVTFSSADLTANLVYCFNFSSSFSTTGSGGDDKTGSIFTKNSSNTTIDSTAYAVSIVSNNQIGLSATVPPQVSDLPIAIESTTTGSDFPQHTVLDYKITYGLLAATSFPVTIQASWSKGTIAGSPTPSVDLLDYVIGSATNAYGGTSAVVDTVNRTITWTINSFPANTINQTVTFELETNDSYTGEEVVSFDVLARSSSESTVTPDQTVSQTYLYDSGLEPTPTPGPTATPAPGPTATPTPTPTQTFAFSQVRLQTVSQSQAQIYVAVNKNSTITVQYGTTLSSMSQSVATSLPTNEALLTLSNLKPDTNYYYRVIAKDASNNTIRSDIFTFRTALISEAPAVDLQSLIATSNNNFLLNPQAQIATGQLPSNTIVIPFSTNFEIQFSLLKHLSVKNIQLIIRNKNVLGASTIISTANAEAMSNNISLVETAPGIYTGKIKSMPKPGFYEIYARILDYNGNILEQKIADLTVTTRFTVNDKSNGKGIDNARVLLYLYDLKARLYQLISPQTLPIPNPAFSINDGTLNIVLPPGRYKAEISILGYMPKAESFEITPSSIKYPTIYLQAEPFNIVSFFQYLGESFMDSISINQQYLSAISSSGSLFTFIESLTLLAFVALCFLCFSAKTHIPLFSAPYFFVHKLKGAFLRESALTTGKVFDEVSQDAVSKASVYLIDAKHNKVLSHLKTNKLGEFYFRRLTGDKIKISVIKKGFVASPMFEYSQKSLNTMPIEIGLEKDTDYKMSVLELLALALENVFGAFMEFLLVFTVILEIYFIPPLGILKVLPFLILSIFNVTLLILYLYKPRGLILKSPLVHTEFTA